MDDVVEIVKQYIVEELVPGSNPDKLHGTTPLFSEGLLDSLTTAGLVTFVQKRFEIEFGLEDINQKNFDCLDNIAKFVESKKSTTTQKDPSE